MFESLLIDTDAAIFEFIFKAWTRFIETGKPWVLGMSTIFVIITGYLLLAGRLNLSLSELFPRVVKWLAILAIVLNFDAMIILLYNLFTNVPEAVATQIAGVGGATGGGINASVGVIWEQGLDSAKNMFGEASWTSWSPIAFAFLILIVTILMVVYVTFLIMLAKLAVAVLLGLAPFFIVLYLFDATRPVFEGWLRQLISFALIPVFLYGLLALLISMMETMSNKMLDATVNGVWGITHVGPYALVMLVGLLLTTQVMGWAAGVGGGFSLSAGRAAGVALGAATGGAGAFAGQIARRSGLANRVSNLSNRLGVRGWNKRDGGPQAPRTGPKPSAQRDQDRWQDRSRRDRNRPS